MLVNNEDWYVEGSALSKCRMRLAVGRTPSASTFVVGKMTKSQRAKLKRGVDFMMLLIIVRKVRGIGSNGKV
jgi:hypothetical protein